MAKVHSTAAGVATQFGPKPVIINVNRCPTCGRLHDASASDTERLCETLKDWDERIDRAIGYLHAAREGNAPTPHIDAAMAVLVRE